VEITLEANPGTIDASRLRAFARQGVVDCPSAYRFDDGATATLAHSRRRSSAACIDLAQAAGFARINIDLMHGLPQQTSANGAQDLNRLAQRRGAHFCTNYHRANTAFYSAPPQLPDETPSKPSNSAALTWLRAQALRARYEVSAWCRDHAMARTLELLAIRRLHRHRAGAQASTARDEPSELEVVRYPKAARPRTTLAMPARRMCNAWQVQTWSSSSCSTRCACLTRS